MKKIIEIEIPDGYQDAIIKDGKVEFIKKESRCLNWEQYIEKYPQADTILAIPRLVIPFTSLERLLILREHCVEDWDVDSMSVDTPKYCVFYDYEEALRVVELYETRRVLSFPTAEMAHEFIEVNRDLIEKAKSLL